MAVVNKHMEVTVVLTACYRVADAKYFIKLDAIRLLHCLYDWMVHGCHAKEIQLDNRVDALS